MLQVRSCVLKTVFKPATPNVWLIRDNTKYFTPKHKKITFKKLKQASVSAPRDLLLPDLYKLLKAV